MTKPDLVAWAERIYPHLPGGPWRVYDRTTESPAADPANEATDERSRASADDELLVGNGTHWIQFIYKPGIDRWDHNWKVQVVCTDNARGRTVRFTQGHDQRRPVHVISRIALELYGPTRCPKAWFLHLAMFLTGVAVACGQWWDGVDGAGIAVLVLAALFGLPFGALSTVPSIDADETDTDRGGHQSSSSAPDTYYRSPAMRTCALTRWAFAYRRPDPARLATAPLSLLVPIAAVTLASSDRHWASFFGQALFFSLFTVVAAFCSFFFSGTWGYAVQYLYQLPRRDDLTRFQRLARWYRVLVGPTLLVAIGGSMVMAGLPDGYGNEQAGDPQAAGFADLMVDLFTSAVHPQWLVWMVRIAFIAAFTMMAVPMFFGGKHFNDHLRETSEFDQVPDGVASYPWMRLTNATTSGAPPREDVRSRPQIW